jgi:hypothetical protein
MGTALAVHLRRPFLAILWRAALYLVLVDALLGRISRMLRHRGSVSDAEPLHEDAVCGRLEHGRPGQPIPDELLLEILDYIAPGPSFSPGECDVINAVLSQTCRLFASVAIPRRFRDLHFPALSGAAPAWLQMVRTGHPDDRVAALHVASLVRSVSVNVLPGGRPVGRNEDTNYALSAGDFLRLASALDSLLLLPHLTRMTLCYMLVPGQLLDIIANMETLQRLTLELCCFLVTDRERMRSHATEFRIMNNGVPGRDMSGISERLTLTGLKGLVHARTLRMLELRVWDGPAVGNRIFRECGPFPVLEEVVLSLFANGDPFELSETLSVLLERTPSLKILRVLTDPRQPVPSRLPRIHANLPRLSVIEGPAWMLPLVCAGRAVSTLHLHPPLLDLSGPLQLNPPLLDLSVELLVCAAAKDLFARLKELRIDDRFLDPAGSVLRLSHCIVTLVIDMFISNPHTLDDVSDR